MNATPQKRRRLVLGLLALLFLAPVAMSFYLYYGGWRARGDVSHGDLITPARPLPKVSLSAPDGTATAAVFDGKWSLIYAGDGRCEADCRHALYVTRQVRLALNQNMDRVQRVFLYRGECCEEPYFSAEQAGLITRNLDSADGAKLDAVLESSAPTADGKARIFVADPLGNLVLSYRADTDPRGMIADLKKLLKLSHIG
jgi:cytochrome oxidase Cu insertion factor (SCO1/SenC/PrrC family)